jgi:hypothetical protein
MDDLTKEVELAEEKSKAAHHEAMEAYGTDNKYVMTFAEAIGLPRMFKDPWGLTKNEISSDLVFSLKDNALVYAHSAVLGHIASALRWQALGKDQAHWDLGLLRKNEAVIAKEITQRKFAATFAQTRSVH